MQPLRSGRHATKGEDDRCGKDAEDDDDNQKLDEGEPRLELDALSVRLDVADVPNHFAEYRLSGLGN